MQTLKVGAIIYKGKKIFPDYHFQLRTKVE